jgi:hypothetical protein
MNQKSGAARRSGGQGFTEKQGQYLAFIYAYSRMFRRPPAEADNATSASAHPRFIRWSSPSSELALSDANPASPEASSYLLPRKICPS